MTRCTRSCPGPIKLQFTRTNNATRPAREILGFKAQSDSPARGGLARRLGTTTATLMTAGMIIGTGIFGATGAAAARAGSGILLAMALGGLVCLFTGVSAVQLGVNYPKEGGA